MQQWSGPQERRRSARKSRRNTLRSHHDEEAMKALSEEIEAEVTNDSVLEVDKIIGEVVKLAMRKVKPGRGT